MPEGSLPSDQSNTNIPLTSPLGLLVNTGGEGGIVSWTVMLLVKEFQLPLLSSIWIVYW